MLKLVVWWAELLTAGHEVPGSILGFAMGILPSRVSSHVDISLGSLVELKCKAPPCNSYTCTYITIHLIRTT
jgi:hypothetical protein